MLIEISKEEAWKLLDAIKSYTSDYVVTAPVKKTLYSVAKKLETITNG